MPEPIDERFVTLGNGLTFTPKPGTIVVVDVITTPGNETVARIRFTP
jgi:hypothetical protein